MISLNEYLDRYRRGRVGGYFHRLYLLRSGLYICTSAPDAHRFKIVGESGPELVRIPETFRRGVDE